MPRGASSLGWATWDATPRTTKQSVDTTKVIAALRVACKTARREDILTHSARAGTTNSIVRTQMPSASSVTQIMRYASLSSNVCLVRELIPTFTSFVCSRFAWSTPSQWGTTGRLTNSAGGILCSKSCTIIHQVCTSQGAAWLKMTALHFLAVTMLWYDC